MPALIIRTIKDWLPRLLPLIAKLEFNGSERQKLWRNLAEIQRYDLSIDDALEKYRARLKNNPLLGKVLDAVIAARRDSHQLDIAFATFIPAEECMLIRAGVATNLADSLDLCADLIEAKQKIINGLINALAYPVMLLTTFVALLVVIAVFVMPQLAMIGDPEQWGTAARVLFRVSEGLASPVGLGLLVVLVLAFFAALVSLPYWTGPLRLRVENLPPWSFYRIINGSIWMFTVATMMQANISLKFILEDMAKAENMSPWLKERILAIQNAHHDAGALSVTLKNAGMNFPDSVLLDDLESYEGLPSFHRHFYELTKAWLGKSQRRIEQKLKALSGGLICLVGILICSLAVATGSLQQSLSNFGGF